MATECCVCYETKETINAKYAASFITIPCGGKHVVCFPCFIKNENDKCPMCRYDYVAGVRRYDVEQEEAHIELEGEPQRYEPSGTFNFSRVDPTRLQLEDLQALLEEDAQRRIEEEARALREEEEYEDQYRYEFYRDHHYSFYQDLNREFNGKNYQQAVDEAARIWKEFARLDQTAQDGIYEKLIGDKFYIYKQLRNEMQGNEDCIIRMFDSSFDVCRVVYISRIISQPENEEAVERLKEFELRVEEEMDNAL